MKKIALFIICLTSISCNKQDDSNNQNTNIPENILGEWKLSRREMGGILQDLEVCETLTTIKFFQNAGFEIELFIGDDMDNCQSANNTGIWEYLGEDEINIQLDTQNEPTLFRVSLSDNDNKLVLIEYANGDIVQLEEYIRG